MSRPNEQDQPSPSSSSPPSYSSPASLADQLAHPYPQPYPRPPSLSSRKSSTIISILPHDQIDDVDDDAEAGPSSFTRTHLDEFYHHDDGAAGLSYDDPRRELASAPAQGTQGLPLHMRDNELERQWSSSSTGSTAHGTTEARHGENTPLLPTSSSPNDGGEGVEGKWYNGPVFVTAVKLGILFTLFTGVVVGTFYFGIPKMDPGDRAVLKLPRSFADLQALNNLFQKYKHRNPYRILACGVVSYLFVQTFSLPGSMYISILFGAAYGIIYGLLLSCLCESIGSVFCYTLSSLLAPPLLALPFYRARVETWRIKIMGDPRKGKQVTWDGVFAFLIVLRIAPFPPHWVANFVAPHLNIGVFLFWASCFIGIAPVSVIHVTIGSSLDSMTSAADFHILSLRNVLGLCAVVVAVLIPVGLKRVFKKDLGDLGDAEEVFEETGVQQRDIQVPAVGDGQARRYHAIDSGVVLAAPSRGDGMDMRSKTIKGKGRALEIIPDMDEDEEDDEDLARLLGDAIDSSVEDRNYDQVYGSEGEGESSSPSSSQSQSVRTPRYFPQEDDYQIYDTTGRFDRIKLASKPKPYRPNTLKGYGSIDPPSVVAPGMGIGEREMSVGGWWPFARTGVA